jgi:hypothetical protein
MTSINNDICLVIHRTMIHRFRVQVLQNPPFCSSTRVSCPSEELISCVPEVAEDIDSPSKELINLRMQRILTVQKS